MSRLYSFAAICSMFMSVGCTCNYSNHYTVHLNPNLGADGIQSAIESLDDWSLKTHNMITFKVVIEAKSCDDDCSHEFTIAKVPSKFIHDHASESLCGLTAWRRSSDPRSKGDWANAFIEEELWLKPFDLNKIMRHEIGHALGLEHSDIDTIMHYNTGNVAEVTCKDAVAALQLRYNVIPPCYTKPIPNPIPNP